MTTIRGALGTSGMAVAMLAGFGGGDAEAAEPGTPIQLAAPNACLANLAIGGCSPFKSFNRPLNIDVAPDGADVYMANQSGTIGRFRRDPGTNALTGADFVNFGGGDLSDVFVASSGTLLVGAGGSTSGDGMVESFSRDPSTGALTAIGCAEEGGSLYCANAEGIGGADEVALPPSGPGVYVAAEYGGPDGPDGGSTPDGSIAVLTVGGSPGNFKQLECIAAIKAASGACSDQSKDEPVLRGPSSVAVSPDGRNVYFGGFGGLVGYNRDPATGKLVSEAECMLRSASGPFCSKEVRLPIADQLVISPDGEFLYAGGANSFTVLDRNPASGTLSVVECMKSASSAASCPVEPAFGGGTGIATSPDGSTLYVAGGGSGEGFLRAFRVDKATGQLADLACVTFGSAPGCVSGSGFMWPSSADATADGSGLYVLGYEGTGTGDLGALAEFRIEQPPAGPAGPEPGRQTGANRSARQTGAARQKGSRAPADAVPGHRAVSPVLGQSRAPNPQTGRSQSRPQLETQTAQAGVGQLQNRGRGDRQSQGQAERRPRRAAAPGHQRSQGRRDRRCARRRRKQGHRAQTADGRPQVLSDDQLSRRNSTRSRSTLAIRLSPVRMSPAAGFASAVAMIRASGILSEGTVARRSAASAATVTSIGRIAEIRSAKNPSTRSSSWRPMRAPVRTSA